ncbi:MAG: hypothetical protein KDE46_24350 [Caldilineaceae bacterium]|nr:hypothetical protein [Caldilineaceae bacterium]
MQGGRAVDFAALPLCNFVPLQLAFIRIGSKLKTRAGLPVSSSTRAAARAGAAKSRSPSVRAVRRSGSE